MIMFEHSRRLSEPLRLGRRERTILALVGACCVLAVAGLVAFALTTGAPARRDCITVVFASTLGGAEEHACGPQARRVCASPGAFVSAREELRAACRRAGFAFGRG